MHTNNCSQPAEAFRPHSMQPLHIFYIKETLIVYSIIFTSAYCTLPSAPEDGSYMNEYEIQQLPGSNITFQCRDEFRLSGPSMITCQDDGTWNPSPPICESIYGNLHFTLNYTNSKIFIMCSNS